MQSPPSGACHVPFHPTHWTGMRTLPPVGHNGPCALSVAREHDTNNLVPNPSPSVHTRLIRQRYYGSHTVNLPIVVAYGPAVIERWLLNRAAIIDHYRIAGIFLGGGGKLFVRSEFLASSWKTFVVAVY